MNAPAERDSCKRTDDSAAHQRPDPG